MILEAPQSVNLRLPDALKRTAAIAGNILQLDTNGNPALDGAGVIGVMAQPAGSPVTIPNATVTSLAYAVLPSSTLTINPARMTTYMFQSVFFASYQGAAGTFAHVQLQLDGAQVGNEQVFQLSGVGAGLYWNGMCLHTAALAAGSSHTIALAYKTDNLGSNFIFQGGTGGLLYAFQLGA